MTNPTPTVFLFNTYSVRVTEIDGSIWFVAADVCAALGLENVTKALLRLDADEMQVIDFATLNSIQGVKNQQLNPGQQINIINESGLYSLILTSRKPEAKAFKRWVTSEVLPAIRKRGRYETDSPPPQPVTQSQLLDLYRSAQEVAGQLKHFPRSERTIYNCVASFMGADKLESIPADRYQEAKRLVGILLVAFTDHRLTMENIERRFLDQIASVSVQGCV
jgi:prophage antirepressor-like protein